MKIFTVISNSNCNDPIEKSGDSGNLRILGSGGRLRFFKLFLVGCLSFGLGAEEISLITTEVNPILERRLHSLVEDLRCPVCQNESLASSRAPLAQDLRKAVQAQMEQGKSNQEILVFLKERYGDFIYYQPPLNSTTFLLWFGPVILLVGGGLWLLLYLRRWKQ